MELFRSVGILPPFHLFFREVLRIWFVAWSCLLPVAAVEFRGMRHRMGEALGSSAADEFHGEREVPLVAVVGERFARSEVGGAFVGGGLRLERGGSSSPSVTPLVAFLLPPTKWFRKPLL